MRNAAAVLALLLLTVGVADGQQVQPKIRHIVVSVVATNDEWTTTGLNVDTDDMILVTAAGRITVGSMTGQVDAAGSPSGYGLLEYKVGVGAGKPAGKGGLLTAPARGELKFRVKDTRYDDNAGAFEVDVIVVPQVVIPAATRVGDMPQQDAVSAAANDLAKAIITEMKTWLRDMVSTEETFFSDSARYTNKLSQLNTKLPQGVTLKSLNTPTKDSWTAVVTHVRMPTVQCAIAVNAKNPVVPTAGEGEPSCK